MISAISCLFSGRSHHIWASITAIISATVALGLASTQSARIPRIFSGWRAHSSPVVAAVKPMPWFTSCSFHGSPTQKASMLPTFMLATICGGGTTIRSTSRVGSIPPAASQ